MKNMPALRLSFFLFTFIILLSAGVFAQDLTIRDIMAEPSIAGMRVEGEKLSPDGTKVIYLWNAEGKPLRDLYMVSTSGGTPEIILRSSDLPVPTRTPQPENKLNYGVDMRDDFVKARENQLGNFEWSPDSKRLLFTHGGDLYVLTLDGLSTERIASRWQELERVIQKRTDAIPILVQALRDAGVEEQEQFRNLANSRTEVLNQIRNYAAGATKNRSDDQKKAILAALGSMNTDLRRVEKLVDVYPLLRDSERVMGLLFEMAGNENRLNVALADNRNSAAQSRLKRLTKTQSPEFGGRFLDNDRIMFSQTGNVFALNTADFQLTQLTREANQQANISVGNSTPNEAGTMIAYVVSDSSKYRSLVVPNYLPEFVAANPTRRGWSEQKLFAVPTDGSRDTPIEIKLPKSEGVSNFRRMVWAADGKSLVVDRVDKDTKRRQLYYVHNVGSKAEQIILVTEETDDKWQAPLSSIFEPHPKDPAQLFFGSERDGYNHLYLAKLEPGKPEPNSTGEKRQENPTDAGYSTTVAITQLTDGNWQVEWAKWSSGDRILFISTQSSSSEREFYHLLPASKTIHPLSSEKKGFKSSPQLAEAGGNITSYIYELSTWNRPGELFAANSCNVKCELGPPVQLTRTTPSAFLTRSWNEPKFLEIDSRDGKKIPAKIYLPKSHDPKSKTKYPMVVFVHGAGYLQNVINGWNNYYREFMFNEMLTQKGYVVLDIDYRGSAGYGRDWRTDVYDFLGGKDYDDHIDSIDFMVKNYAVDPAKVGAYGGSYGGFMAAMLALRAPDKLAAAAALRPVMDWKNYYATNPGYTAQRLGFPDKNPEAYKRSSPISYADKLERPLLILHGMSDDNVHVQDSVQMMEKLIRLGKTKYFEAMLYPSENHGFVRPESWTDEYERIFAFFEKHLK